MTHYYATSPPLYSLTLRAPGPPRLDRLHHALALHGFEVLDTRMCHAGDGCTDIACRFTERAMVPARVLEMARFDELPERGVRTPGADGELRWDPFASLRLDNLRQVLWLEGFRGIQVRRV